MQVASAAWPLNEAVVAVIEGDAIIKAMLAEPYIYSGSVAPATAKMPYLTIPDTAEDPRNTFGRGGNQCVLTVHIWHHEAGQEGVLRIYGRMVELFRGQAVAVTGHTVYRCTCRLIGSITDPTKAQHGIVEISALVMNG